MGDLLHLGFLVALWSSRCRSPKEGRREAPSRGGRRRAQRASAAAEERFRERMLELHHELEARCEEVCALLARCLPLVTAHPVDFFTEDLWHANVPAEWVAELRALDDAALQTFGTEAQVCLVAEPPEGEGEAGAWRWGTGRD